MICHILHYVPGPPEGIIPLFLATKSQEIFSCITDEHVTEDEPFKLIKKEDIIEDMKMRAAISDFSPVKRIVLVRERRESYFCLLDPMSFRLHMHKMHAWYV